MEKYQKALLIYNGNAGQGSIDQKLGQTIPILSQSIKELIIIGAESIRDLKDTCKNYSDQIDLLIILGGDGTVHECINSIAPLNERPAFAILPGGTSNDFSRILGISQNLSQAAKEIVGGKIKAVDLGKSNDMYFLNFWGIGLVAETSQNVSENGKGNLGVLSYFISTLKTINQTQPFSCKITTETDIYEGDAVLVAVLNGKYIGTREIPIDTVQPDDGLLDVIIVKNSNLASFRELLTLNSPNRDEDNIQELRYFQARQLHIETVEEKEIDMDGEIQIATPANIQILPRYLNMVTADQS